MIPFATVIVFGTVSPDLKDPVAPDTGETVHVIVIAPVEASNEIPDPAVNDVTPMFFTLIDPGPFVTKIPVSAVIVVATSVGVPPVLPTSICPSVKELFSVPPSITGSGEIDGVVGGCVSKAN